MQKHAEHTSPGGQSEVSSHCSPCSMIPLPQEMEEEEETHSCIEHSSKILLWVHSPWRQRGSMHVRMQGR